MKQGQVRQLLWIGIMVLGAGVFLTFLNAVLTVANTKAYLRELSVLGRGIDLIAVQAFPSDTNANREIPEAGADTLVFESTQVTALENGNPSSVFLSTQAADYQFIGGEFKPELGKTIGALTEFKRGKRYGVAKPADVPSEYLLSCTTPKGKQLKKIALDPGHGYDASTAAGDEGYKLASGISESAYTLKLANAVAAGRPRFNPTRALGADSAVAVKDRQQTAGDVLISVHVGIREDGIDVVKAYYNPTPESRRLACEMLNEITEEFKVPVNLVPTNTEYLTEDDPKQVLKGTRLAVLLEIGNAKKADSMLKESGQLAAEIYKGIENYGLE